MTATTEERIYYLEMIVKQHSTEMGRMERDLADLLRWKQREENKRLVGL
jgi:hypothetical protein